MDGQPQSSGRPSADAGTGRAHPRSAEAADRPSVADWPSVGARPANTDRSSAADWPAAEPPRAEAAASKRPTVTSLESDLLREVHQLMKNCGSKGGKADAKSGGSAGAGKGKAHDNAKDGSGSGDRKRAGDKRRRERDSDDEVLAARRREERSGGKKGAGGCRLSVNDCSCDKATVILQCYVLWHVIQPSSFAVCKHLHLVSCNGAAK